MDEWRMISNASALRPGRAMPVRLSADQWVALCRDTDGRYYACDNCCPHAGGTLGYGTVAGGRIVCPVHQFAFDLRTGVADPPLPGLRLQLYPVEVRKDAVFVRLDGTRRPEPSDLRA